MNVQLAGYQAISILHGGPNTQLRNIARHLRSFGVTPKLFDPWGGVRPGECDLFHVFAANIGTFHLAREIRALGIPLVVSPIIYSRHSPFFVKSVLHGTRLLQQVGKGFWSDYSLAADVCSWASGVLPNSRAEAQLVHEGLGIRQEKITVVPNGVDERFARGDPSLFEKKFGFRDFILNVGHIGHERKNVLALIKALGQIDHPAVIIGRIIKSPYGEACVREAARHKHILVIDGMDNTSDLLASAYAACDVFVLPSLFETPGIAALEAALAGAKIVITQHGGTNEYFEDRAIYVDPSSVESIKEGIRQALNLTKNRHLSEHIHRHFTWPRVAELTAMAYRQVLS